MTAKYETLGDIANELQVMKDQGMTKSSVLYAMSHVFFEEVEPGEYAEQRIRMLTEQWEETVNYGRDESEEPYRASDYALSEDDWRAGLDDEEAAEIARLIEWKEEQK